MPATFMYATNKELLNYYGEDYVVCFLTAIDGEGYRRYIKKDVVATMNPGDKYLFSFNIEAKSHRVFIVEKYDIKSLVSVERRRD